MEALRRESLYFFFTKPTGILALPLVSHSKERVSCQHEELRESPLPCDKPGIQTLDYIAGFY